ncbi:MAG: hypothetical protein CME06_08970 [Gemmatimonadetes bacterium]|nr:hypothetical protein [Gemmatimonadota bacterium]
MAAALLAIAACTDPFDLREGEPHEELPEWWLIPVTPQLVLEDLVQLYENQAASLISNLAAEGYRFLPDPSDAVSFPDAKELDVDDEERFTLSLLANPPTLTLTPSRPDGAPVNDEIELYRDYTLTVASPFGNEPPPVITAEGEAVFRLQRSPVGVEWEIVEWEDRRGATEWSWGLMKLELTGGG